MNVLEDKEQHEYDGRALLPIFACTQYLEKLRDGKPFTNLVNYWISVEESDEKLVVFFRPKRLPDEMGLFGGVTSLGSYMEFTVEKESFSVENIRLFK